MSSQPTRALAVAAQSNDPAQQVVVEDGTDVRIVGRASNRGAEESRLGLEVDGRRVRVAVAAGSAEDTFQAVCRALPRGYRAEVVESPGPDLVVFQVRPASAAASTPVPPAPPVSATATALLRFARDYTQTLEGRLNPGGQLTIEYDPARAKLTHSLNGFPAWGVQAFVRLVPGGEVVEGAAVVFQSSFGRPAKRPLPRPVVVPIPDDATEVQVWFRNWTGADRPAEFWDSNFGQNYRFPVDRG
jgi:hypothetical protein